VSAADDDPDRLRALADVLPRPARFLVVGGLGLITDMGMFSLVAAFGPHALAARLASLSIATVITWRLNRALTFDRSGRPQHHEAGRYAIVTAVAQCVSYGVFATLVLTVLATQPLVAIVIGAAVGATISYTGHQLLSFAPKAVPPRSSHRTRGSRSSCVSTQKS